MKIFHAIDNAGIVPVFFDKTGVKPNILISYYYIEGNAKKLTGEFRNYIESLQLDCGTFTGHTKGIEIIIHEYRLYLKRYGHLFDDYYSLDDRFDDPEHNYYNLKYLEEGLVGLKKPIPVIHDPEDPLAELRMYAEMGYDYIALGSMGAHKRIDPVIIDEIRKDYPDLKLHLFGSLNLKILEKYRPYSADSSSWAQQGGMAGSIYYWRPSEKKAYSYYVGGREKSKGNGIHIKKSPFFGEIENFLRDTFSFTYGDLLTSAEAKQVVNMYFFYQYENYLNGLDKG